MKKRNVYTASFTLLLSTMLAQVTAQAAVEEVLDQSNLPGPSRTSVGPVTSNSGRGQTFTVGVNGTLRRVEIIVGENPFFCRPDAPLIFELRETTVTGTPYGAILATVLIPEADVPGSFPNVAFISVDLVSFGISVSVGDVLGIVLSTNARFSLNDPTKTCSYGWGGTFETDQNYVDGDGYVNFFQSQDNRDYYFQTFVDVDLTPTVIGDINIKPGSDPNSINTCSGGSTPVTIFGSAGLVVATIDPTSLILASANVKLVGKSLKILCSIEDIGKVDNTFFDDLDPTPDGEPDLTCQFLTIALTDLADNSISANLTGNGCDSATPFPDCSGVTPAGFFALVGSDSVNVVKDCDPPP